MKVILLSLNIFVGDKGDKTGKKKLFDVTDMQDADEDEITASNNICSSSVNGSNDNFIKILTSLLDSTVTTYK
jgi:hypothetical protein